MLGQKLGNFIITGLSPRLYRNSPVFFIRCSCNLGTYLEREFIRLKPDKLINCNKEGCNYRRKDIAGQVFGKLTAVKVDYVDKNKTYWWVCRCSCGNLTSVKIAQLRNGDTSSCGCSRSKPRKHGLCDTKAYKIWTGIKGRCYNPHNSEYRNYGGRIKKPIKMCDDWKENALSFCLWYSSKESELRRQGVVCPLEVDRITDSEFYSPETCRLTDKYTNNVNKRTNFYIEFEGKRQSLPLVYRELCSRNQSCLVNYSCFYTRIRAGWEVSDAFYKKKQQRIKK